MVAELTELFEQEPLYFWSSLNAYADLATGSSQHPVEAQNYLVSKTKEDACGHSSKYLQVSQAYILDCFFESLSQTPSTQFGHLLRWYNQYCSTWYSAEFHFVLLSFRHFHSKTILSRNKNYWKRFACWIWSENWNWCSVCCCLGGLLLPVAARCRHWLGFYSCFAADGLLFSQGLAGLALILWKARVALYCLKVLICLFHFDVLIFRHLCCCHGRSVFETNLNLPTSWTAEEVYFTNSVSILPCQFLSVPW